MELQALRALTGIPDCPCAFIDFAQDTFGRRVVVIHLDVLEHLVSKSQGIGEKIRNLIITFRFEKRFEHLGAPLHGPRRVGDGTIYFCGGGCRQQVYVVFLLGHDRDLRWIWVDNTKKFDFFQGAQLVWATCDRVGSVTPEDHRLYRVGLFDRLRVFGNSVHIAT